MKSRLHATLATVTTALGIAAGTVATPVAAHATPNVTVHLALSAGRYLPTGAACPLSVPAGADGVEVLEAAKTAHCIVSYATVTYAGFGTFLTCIDEVCGQALTGTAGTYWNMYENGTSTTYGVDGFAAAAGDELAFAYKPYCFDAVCPPDLDGV